MALKHKILEFVVSDAPYWLPLNFMRTTRVLLHVFSTDVNESEHPKWLNLFKRCGRLFKARILNHC